MCLQTACRRWLVRPRRIWLILVITVPMFACETRWVRLRTFAFTIRTGMWAMKV